jgi:hypothetical protein
VKENIGGSSKPLSPKQMERLRDGDKIEGGKTPPWVNALNLNTARDLKRFFVWAVIDLVPGALETGKHREQLLDMKKLAERIDVIQNHIAHATKREPKYRERAAELIGELELAISQLDNSTGFDLFNKETW